MFNGSLTEDLRWRLLRPATVLYYFAVLHEPGTEAAFVPQKSYSLHRGQGCPIRWLKRPLVPLPLVLAIVLNL